VVNFHDKTERGQQPHLVKQQDGASRGRGTLRSPSPTGGGRYSLKTARCPVSGGPGVCVTKHAAKLTHRVITVADYTTDKVINMTTSVMLGETHCIND
jgi:hypothetical protein